MALLEDQLEEARQAFHNAHEAGDQEAATALAQRVFELEGQLSTVSKAAEESSKAGTDLKNPATAALAGAAIGAVTNPIRGAVHDIITPAAPAPKISAPSPQTLSISPTTKTPYNPRGSSVEESVANWSNYADAQTQAAKGVRRDTSLLKKYPNMQLGGAGAATTPTPSAPVTPPTMGEKGKDLLRGLVADHQPNSPFSIIKGGTRGAITGAAAADIPQQIAQDNYGTAAADVGIGAGNIIHGLARTPKGKALGALLGLGSGAARTVQGVNELMPDQKAEGGLVHLAGGGVANALTQTAINAPFIAPTATGIAKNVAKGAYAPAIEDAASLGLAMAPLNPVTAALSLMAPGEAGAGSTLDEWKAQRAAEEAARQRAQKQFEHEQFMHERVGANAPKLLEQYMGQKVQKKAAGGEVLKAAAKKLFDPRFDKRVGEIPKLHSLERHVEPTHNIETPKIYLPDYEGHPFVTSMSDRTDAGGKLLGVNNTMFDRAVDLTGGQGYMFDPRNPGRTWESGKGPSSAILKSARAVKDFTGKDPIYLPWRMAPTGSDFSPMTGETMLAHAQTVMGKDDKAGVDKLIKNYIPNWQGIDHPESFNQFGNQPTAVRKAVQQALDKQFRNEGGLGLGEARLAITDPRQLNAPEGGLQNVGRIFSEQDLIKSGPGSRYPYGVPGEGIGTLDRDINIAQLLPKWVKERGIQDPTRPGQTDIRALQMKPYSGILTDKILQDIGFKSGGSVEAFAPGGKVGAIKKVAEDLQAAYKAKFTPGFYHGSPNPNIEAFDPLKSTVRDKDFVTPGVTFVTKSPKFADSFTNGKGPYISLKTGEAMPAQNYSKGSTMYPVSVDMSNHFDPTTPEGREIVRDYVAKKYADNPEMARKFASRIEDPHSNWTTMESPSFLQHLRDTGHTSFAVNESGYPNVGVLDPTKIRGKFAKFNPEDADSPDFMKAAGGLVHLAGGGGLPEKVVKAYKLFRTKADAPNELYPLFVNANKPVPLGEWVNAEVGPVAASGKVKSKLGELAYRPGWHAGDLPVATHIGGKSDPTLKAPDFRRPDEVWAEVEMPNDVDWQTIANQRAELNKAGQPIARTAHITDQVPEGGFYRYKTSPNMQGNWLIGGGMKVNRVLTDEEVQAINEAAGVADLPRFSPLPKKAAGGTVEGYAPGGKVGALSELMQLIKQQGGTAAAKRLERAADLVPNLEHQFQPQALKSAFTGDNASAVMVMNPRDFEKYASPISAEHKLSPTKSYGIGNAETFENYDAMPKGTYQDYINYLSQYSAPGGGGFSSVPFLQLSQKPNKIFPNIEGHEGRHRTAALAQQGDESTLVKMMPTYNLRENLPRRSQEEYLQALTEKLGPRPLVMPEITTNPDKPMETLKRGLIDLPDMFKKGGKVKK